MTYGLDFNLGIALLRSELFGDWYRDPWGFEEFFWFEKEVRRDKSLVDAILEKRKSGICLKDSPSFNLLEVPKSYLGIRPGVLLHPEARIIYAAAVAPHIKNIHSRLPNWVYGWRSRGGKGLRRNSYEREDYREEARRGLKEGWVLKTDITSCFASINVDILRELLTEKIGKSASLSLVMQVIEEHNRLASRTGIPQRSFASAAIANIFMEPVDFYLSRLIEKGKVKSAIRWMDDIHIFGNKSDLYEVNAELNQRVRSIGLELNASKSALISAREAVIEFQHEDKNKIDERRVLVPSKESPSAYTVELQVDSSVLLELEEKVLSDPFRKDVPPLGNILRALRKSRLFKNYKSWLEVSENIPAQAATLGRYLREAAEFENCPLQWEQLEEWFLGRVNSPWAYLSWTKAQLALSLKSREGLDGRVVDYFIEWIENSDDVQLVAIAIQRLSRSHPNLVRDVIRERADRVKDSMMLRNFALGLLGLNEERSFVKKILERDSRNLITKRMVESRNFKPLKISEDFDRLDGE